MDRPTIRDVAQQAGVSIATVSRVQRGSAPVADDTRQRVEAAISALRYRPSQLGRSLAERRHAALGIVFPDLSGPYFGQVIRGFESHSNDDHGVLVLSTHGHEAPNERVLDLATRTDGLVILGRTVSDDVIRELRSLRRPVVLLARPPVADADTVRADNAGSAERLTRHLLQHGRRRVAFLGDPAGSPDGRERYAGFLAAHRSAGITPPWPAYPTAYREGEGHAAAKTVLRADWPPDALMCANDEIALGAYSAAQEAGVRIGADVAITGWDDISVARHLAPPLTTVRQPMEQLGARAAQLLMEQIELRTTGGTRAPQQDMLATEIVIRASCGCRPTQGG